MYHTILYSGNLEESIEKLLQVTQFKFSGYKTCIYIKELCFYTVAMNKQKMKLRKQFHLQ